MHYKRLVTYLGRGVAQPVNFMGLLMLFRPDTLHRQQRVLGPAIAFFADARFLAPQIAIDGVTLRDFVITEPLREAQAAAVGELAKQREHLPFEIGRRFLLRIAEEDFVLDFEAAQLRLEKVQLFIDGHEFTGAKSRGDWVRR